MKNSLVSFRHPDKFRPSIFVFLLGCATITFSEYSSARDTLYFRSVPSAVELGQHLFGRKTRGLVVNPIESDSNVTTEERSIGLPVLFHFGKTTLVDSSKPYLDKVGELLQQPRYRNETLIIEGHTDAVGSDAHNNTLSEHRALAVKSYLVERYGIDPLRLFPLGKGERQLFLPESPTAEENRRVEFLRYQR